MSHFALGKHVVKTSLFYVGIAAALIVALPLLAGVAYAIRVLIPVLVVGLLAAMAFSPTARRWLAAETKPATDCKGLAFPVAGLHLHPAHAWAKMEAGGARIGLDSLGLALVGRASSVEPPPLGTRIEQGKTLFTIARGSRRMQVKAPVSGIVAEINREVAEDPSLMRESPYGAGWVVRLEGVQREQAGAPLYTGSALRRFFAAEVDRLVTMLSAEAATLPDGGKLAPDLADQIDDATWSRIAAALVDV